MSINKQINLVIFGIGQVGSTFINQINQTKARLLREQNLEINIALIANSKLALYAKNGITTSWESDINSFSVPYKIDEIIEFKNKNNLNNCIAIDATASKQFVEHYVTLIQNGFHIVAANKIANTLDQDFYRELRFNLNKYKKSFLYETNVGAGLPVIETLKNLEQTGDEIVKIRGVFSGSLSYLFNKFSEEEVSFSEVVKKANKLGLTEPDPRDDLSGKDVARKLLILGRELKFEKELNQVKVESLVPKTLNGKTTLKQFQNRISEIDKPFAKHKNELPDEKVLRYVGELDVITQKMEVKLVSITKNSALGLLKGSDTIFEIFTQAYGSQPIVIQGAGAGKEVTARGLFTDVLKVSNRLN